MGRRLGEFGIFWLHFPAVLDLACAHAHKTTYNRRNHDVLQITSAGYWLHRIIRLQHNTGTLLTKGESVDDTSQLISLRRIQNLEVRRGDGRDVEAFNQRWPTGVNYLKTVMIVFPEDGELPPNLDASARAVLSRSHIPFDHKSVILIV